MTPPAATAQGLTRAARPRHPPVPAHRAATLPRGARRVSGPRAGLGAVRLDGAIAGGGTLYTPLSLRVARRAAGVPDARLLDRLIRGRLWIVIVGAMLIGLVFLQLSLLHLNAGIGQALQISQGLERQNSALRLQVSTMDAGQRVQDAAARAGMVMPAAGNVRYLRAGAVPAQVAVRGIAAPKPPAVATSPPPSPAQVAVVPAPSTPVAATTPQG